MTRPIEAISRPIVEKLLCFCAVTIGIFLLFVPTARANPSPYDIMPCEIRLTVSIFEWAAFVVILAMEGPLLLTLLSWKRVRSLRFLAGWFGLTLCTFALFATYVYIASYPLTTVCGRVNDYVFTYVWSGALLFGELLVVVVEAAVLRKMVKTSAFMLRVADLSTWKSLGFSLVVNTMSAALGFVVTYFVWGS